MSVEAMAIVLHHTPDVSGTDKVVLIGIANHDGDGGSWPSVATLAKYAGVSARATQKSLARLVHDGLVGREVGAGGTAKTRDHERPNLYTLLVSCPSGCDGTTSHRISRSGLGPVPEDTPPLSVGTPEPSLEPSVGQVPAADAASPAKTVTVDGVDSPMPVKGEGLSRALETWACEAGHERPGARTWGATTPWLLGLVDGYLGSGKYSHGVRVALIGEYVDACTEGGVPRELFGHLARLVADAGGPKAFHGVQEAVRSGAGLDGEYVDDPRALTRYAKVVIDRADEVAA